MARARLIRLGPKDEDLRVAGSICSSGIKIGEKKSGYVVEHGPIVVVEFWERQTWPIATRRRQESHASALAFKEQSLPLLSIPFISVASTCPFPLDQASESSTLPSSLCS